MGFLAAHVGLSQLRPVWLKRCRIDAGVGRGVRSTLTEAFFATVLQFTVRYLRGTFLHQLMEY
jgi:hypothetical protein